MAVQYQPRGDRRQLEIVQAWRPSHGGVPSTTLLWAQDMRTGQVLNLVRWGSTLYLPVTEGMHLGIGVYNGSSRWRAYPAYVEAANIYDGGPSDPDDCTPLHMWEAQPGGHMVMDAIMDPHRAVGRPLIMVAHGKGYGVGEATFGTGEFRGQFRVYERSQGLPLRFQPKGLSPRGGAGGLMGYDDLGGDDYATREGVTKSGPSIGTRQQLGIGAGAEEHRGHVDTGKRYEQDSELVAALQVESRHDLQEVFQAARQQTPVWHRNVPAGWFSTWRPPTAPRTAPRVPTAPQPHRSFEHNEGGPAGGRW